MSQTRVALLCNRAISLAEHQCFDDARSAIDEAARLAGDARGLKGLVETARCRLQYLAGDLAAAARHGREAARLLEGHGTPDDSARAVVFWGSVKGAQADYLEALNLFNRALALLHRSRDRRLMVLARWGLGTSLGHLERYKEARDSLAAAEEKAEGALSLMERGRLQSSLGIAHLQCGDHDAARLTLLEALQAFETAGRTDLIADVHNALGSLYVALGDRQSARSSYEQALAVLNDQPGTRLAEAYYELSRLEIMEGRPCEALKRAQAALRVAETLKSELEVGRSLLALGQALLSLEDYQGALPHLRRAVGILSKKGLKLSAVVADDMLGYAERRCRQ